MFDMHFFMLLVVEHQATLEGKVVNFVLKVTWTLRARRNRACHSLIDSGTRARVGAGVYHEGR